MPFIYVFEIEDVCDTLGDILVKCYDGDKYIENFLVTIVSASYYESVFSEYYPYLTIATNKYNYDHFQSESSFPVTLKQVKEITDEVYDAIHSVVGVDYIATKYKRHLDYEYENKTSQSPEVLQRIKDAELRKKEKEERLARTFDEYYKILLHIFDTLERNEDLDDISRPIHDILIGLHDRGIVFYNRCAKKKVFLTQKYRDNRDNLRNKDVWEIYDGECGSMSFCLKFRCVDCNIVYLYTEI